MFKCDALINKRYKKLRKWQMGKTFNQKYQKITCVQVNKKNNTWQNNFYLLFIRMDWFNLIKPIVWIYLKVLRILIKLSFLFYQVTWKDMSPYLFEEEDT